MRAISRAATIVSLVRRQGCARWKFGWRHFKRLAWVMPVGLLPGCAGLVGVSPIVDFQIIVEAVQSCDAPPVGFSTAPTFMEVGFRNVKAACEAFFVDATRAQQQALATNTTLDAGLVGAAAIINATNSAAAAAKALTITTAGVVFGKEIINQYVSIYTFNTHLYKVRKLVKDSMEDYILTARDNAPANYCIAYSYISDLASLCTLAAMKANLDEQVALPSVIVRTPTAHPPARRRRELSRELSLRSLSIGRPPSANYTVRPATF